VQLLVKKEFLLDAANYVIQAWNEAAPSDALKKNSDTSHITNI
jgi:hypothetical protein